MRIVIVVNKINGDITPFSSMEAMETNLRESLNLRAKTVIHYMSRKKTNTYEKRHVKVIRKNVIYNK